MKRKSLLKNRLLFSIILFSHILVGQVYPSFSNEINVTINGLTHDAMEPFISHDGNVLFFNNLNDGVDTKLFYATKVNDSTFTYVGELNGTNQTTQPYLDAVADLDSIGNIYWTSTRNYGPELDNLFHGKINGSNVTNIGRVRGDFNKNTPGWLVMDHGMSIDGQLLYFNNARLDGDNCQGPCETMIGIAQKINDSTFTTLTNSSTLLQTINDNNFKFYAPCISADGLELYYTRYPNVVLQPSSLFEICVAVRNTSSDNFSVPTVLFSKTIDKLIEAPTLTTDGKIMYYHEKTATSHKIMMRYRATAISARHSESKKFEITMFPNPVTNEFIVKFQFDQFSNSKIILTDEQGKVVLIMKVSGSNKQKVDVSNLSTGMYFINIMSANKVLGTKKLVVQ